MSKFLSDLCVTLIDPKANSGRGLWRLEGSLVYLSDKFGMLGVPKGRRTDFASVPRLPFAFVLLGDMGHSAAVVHDWLYDTGRLSRKDSDNLFYEALQVCGVARWKAAMMWFGVRVFGGRLYQSK